jgi:hypothetical protein
VIFIQRPGGLLLLSGAALRALQLALAPLHALALRLANEKGAASNVYGGIEFIVCQCESSPDYDCEFTILAQLDYP